MDDLATLRDEKEREALVRSFVRDMTAGENMWLIRIILKVGLWRLVA